MGLPFPLAIGHHLFLGDESVARHRRAQRDIPRPRGSPHPAAEPRHLQYGRVTGVGLDQAGIDGKALAADKPPCRSAPRHGLETMSQQVASRNRPYRFFATGTSLTTPERGHDWAPIEGQTSAPIEDDRRSAEGTTPERFIFRFGDYSNRARRDPHSFAAPSFSIAAFLVHPETLRPLRGRRLAPDLAVRPTQNLPVEMAYSWLGRLDSNQGMPESKSGALPLGYAPSGNTRYSKILMFRYISLQGLHRRTCPNLATPALRETEDADSRAHRPNLPHRKPERGKQIIYHDRTLKRFGVRVPDQGRMSYVLTYGPNRRRIKLGDVGIVKLAAAREKACDILD